jgi:predicted DCC family thiol-disulfide oxidoreductase YuxK
MTHVLLYDGTCGLCSRVVRFVLGRDKAGRFHFASLQGEVGRELLARHGVVATLDTFRVLEADQSKLLDRSQAALFVAGELGLPWSLLRIARIIPRRLRDRLYDLVARNRHRLGAPAACDLPAPHERSRFLD